MFGLKRIFAALFRRRPLTPFQSCLVLHILSAAPHRRLS